MSLLQILVLAIIQGLTEFLPVSSSAHLILVSYLFSWPDEGLVLDVAVHLGTLGAVLFYFRHELDAMIRAWLLPGGQPDGAWLRSLGLTVALASIPVLVVGLLAYDLVSTWLRDVRIIAGATLVFGILLLIADRYFPRGRNLEDLGLRRGMIIGLAQVLALIPGTSRSGITITMGRMLGFGAEAAARFSFLLSIPVILAAGLHGLYKLSTADTHVLWQEFFLAVLVAGLAGWLCIAAFLALLRKVGLVPFVVYRLGLGAALIAASF